MEHSLKIAFIIANFIALICCQEPFHLDVIEDIEDDARWTLDCENGYARLVTDYKANCEVGGINIPRDEPSDQVGLWTSCDIGLNPCSITYEVQEGDTTFALRINQQNAETELLYDNNELAGVISGNGWVDSEWELTGRANITVKLVHYLPDWFAVLDKIAINNELPPLPTLPTTTEGVEESTTEHSRTTSPRPPHLCAIDDPMEPPNDQCDPDETTPTYLPYPYDCAKYFQCANGIAVCQRCPNTTIWSQEDTVCVRNGTIPCDPPTTTPRQLVVNEYSIINFIKKYFF